MNTKEAKKVIDAINANTNIYRFELLKNNELPTFNMLYCVVWRLDIYGKKWLVYGIMTITVRDDGNQYIANGHNMFPTDDCFTNNLVDVIKSVEGITVSHN